MSDWNEYPGFFRIECEMTPKIAVTIRGKSRRTLIFNSAFKKKYLKNKNYIKITWKIIEDEYSKNLLLGFEFFEKQRNQGNSYLKLTKTLSNARCSCNGLIHYLGIKKDSFFKKYVPFFEDNKCIIKLDWRELN